MTKKEHIERLGKKLAELDQKVDKLYEVFRTETRKVLYKETTSEEQYDKAAAAHIEYRQARQHRDELRSLYTSLKESLQ